VKKILLTGSTGFLGSAILHKIHKDNFIYLVSRKKTKKIRIKKNTNEIYFKDFKQLNSKLKKIKADTIIHCATHYVKAHGESDISKLSNANIVLGNILLDNLENLSVKNFINFSTVWENYDGKKDNFFNLYSVYKRNFSNLIFYYKKRNPKIKFFNLFLSDTFGKFDKRKKIINNLKKNYKSNKITNIVSSNLFLNLVNVEDVTEALLLILKNKIKPGDYNLVNSKYLRMTDLKNKFNLQSKKKLKIKWLSKRLIKEKIYKKNRLKNWSIKNSNIKDIIDIISQ
tara:strand:- start:144 stop:995 length:852 start_codon:yes stop_codon:yes gene_type:complete